MKAHLISTKHLAAAYGTSPHKLKHLLRLAGVKPFAVEVYTPSGSVIRRKYWPAALLPPKHEKAE